MTHWTKEAALQHIANNIIVSETGCHEWQGGRTKDGYGQISNEQLHRTFGIRGAHRLVVHLGGHEFEGRHEQVLHSCHNRCCVNPAHLSVGSAKQNRDQANAHYWDVWLRTGELNPHAKLNYEQVKEIKRRLANGGRTKVLSVEYGVTSSTISAIKMGRNWAHVTF